ncbi:MAG: type II toxin-antitoxin system RelB/DinJ family antitoxin [Alphaproteobacteria bacterium]
MDTKLNIRIDGALKTETEAVLQELGMTMADAVRMTFRQIVMQQRIPFDVSVPNATTLAALAEDTTDEEPISLDDFKTEYGL